MRTSETVNELFEALAGAQAEIKSPSKGKTAKIQTTKGPSYSYSYADLSDVIAAIFATFPKHGLCISQPTIITDGDITIKTIIGHKSGQWIESEYPVCRMNNDHKAMGAAMTYARRYGLSSLAGIAPDEDTDGEGAARPEPKTRQNVADHPMPPDNSTPFDEAPPAAKPIVDVYALGRQKIRDAKTVEALEGLQDRMKERRDRDELTADQFDDLWKFADERIANLTAAVN